MYEQTAEQFVDRPLRVADALSRGESGGSYLEACLLISGVLSGLSAHVWPGEGIDRMRFVETWVRFGLPAQSDARRISVPLLRHTLYSQNVDDAHALERMRPEMFGHGFSNRVVVGEEVDADEGEVLAACATVDRRLARRHSYPAVFYEHVRCQVAHEYRVGGFATQYPMTMKSDPHVSYACTPRFLHMGNDLCAEGRCVEAGCIDASTRQIHFHVPWLIALTRGIAQNIDAVTTYGNLPQPPVWWLREA